jgi:hypothetical protein
MHALAVVDEPVELCVTRLRYAQIHGFSRLAVEPGDKADAEPLTPDQDNTPRGASSFDFSARIRCQKTGASRDTE